ncbi:PAS domain S-box protein [Pseudomonas sp. AN-1]|uniref:PAS domain-containing sensor histidine kinase n=1 Tax=Pseudomonas sp. AN-1 TaxID=3096605 RepID=UPI002A6A610C|nr:transporter substrate-binding domain-containing protein [Pseudomonas sp. AN-1]WPP44787.1 PAS domain S-box protein [Pseudomonas sp. AN-1]
MPLSAHLVRCLTSAMLLLGLCLTLPVRAEPAALAVDAAQRQWLADHPRLQVGVVLQAPYAQFERRQRQQQLVGAHVELMGALASRLGVDLNWHAYPDQAALEAALQRGEIELAPGLQQTPAGLRLWRYSDPYLRIPHLVVGERSGAAAVRLDRLGRGEPVAVREGSPVQRFLRSSHSSLELRPASSERQALRQVLAGEASYAVLDEAQYSRLHGEVEFAALAVLGEVGYPLLLRVAVRPDLPELAGLIDRALRALPAAELEAVQRRWLQPPVTSLGESAGFWRSLALLLGLLLLAVLGAAWWLRRQHDELELRLAVARHDLSLRESAEQALRLAQFSIDHSTVGILWVNWDSHLRYANRAAEQLLGYPARGLVERPLSELAPNLDMDRWLALWKRARASDEALAFETRCRCADGEWLPVDLSLSFLRFRDTEYLVIYLTDVTERRRARAALEESEARLKGIAGNVPGLLFRLERAAPGAEVHIAFIGEGSAGLVGYPAATLLEPERGIRSLVHPDEREHYWSSQQAALAADDDWRWQGRLLTRDGTPIWVDIKATARRLEAGRVVWDGMVWDISELKRTELALAESQAQLRELAAHLESVREEEKARIAREVHDELGQMLTVLKLELSMCQLAHGEGDADLRQRLQHMSKLLAQLFQVVRDVATALRPPILDAGIASAIEWQARRFEARTGIPCLVEVPEQLPALGEGKATGLFRVLQEALTNIMRHAQAHSVEIRLSREAGELQLCIADDGAGFDPAQVRSGSFGLVGMRERVAMFGGSLRLDSTPGQGTTLYVRVPLDREDKETA